MFFLDNKQIKNQFKLLNILTHIIINGNICQSNQIND